MNSILGGIAALIVGSGLAAATVFGVVSSQTSPSGQSPTNVNQPVVPYGSNN